MNINGWIIYNGHLTGSKFLDFAQWLQRAAARQNIDTIIYKNNDLLTFLGSNHLELIGGNKLPDFVIFTDKDIYLARQLELLGVRVFNTARSIEISDNKITTYQALAEKKLPIPKTIVAPKIFLNTVELDTTIAQNAINTLGFPMILKEAYGSFGEQVYLIHNETELITKISEIQGKPFVFQEFIASSYGRDMRLHVVGDNVVAAMVRKASDDFRANVTAGGTMNPYHPTNLEKEMAISATKAIGADFSGVDLLFGPDNTPIICEINSNAHIRNIYECTKIDVSDFIVEYIIDTFKKTEGYQL